MGTGDGGGVLGLRALNRATLERQALLGRSGVSPLEMVTRLVAVQGQEANAPYIGLWTRLQVFRREELTELLCDRRVVRSSLLRGTQHLTVADDYPWLRALVQPLIERIRRSGFGRATEGIDPGELAKVTRELLRGRTLTRPEVGRLLAERYPGRDVTALGWSAQCLVPLVHRPPNGTWGKGGATPFTLAEEWIGRPLEETPSVEELIRRYLAAFGPATVKDVQVWSGLTRLAERVEGMRGELRTFRDEAGRELFDLPDAPLPDGDVPAPVRFLPEFDNLVVGHADRTRLMPDEHRRRVITGSWVRATFLVDGFVRGVWDIGDDGDRATLTLRQYERLAPADREALAEEGLRLLAFAAPDRTHDIAFVPPEPVG
ncbi:winged helix DNA-binding domain-containing protein [Thermomonospora umbrina]|uniref:Winged helix DNA-binding protein n=1 Tax=Thermomonospora umbrina TaxID=111806 RepID=A0A3D9T085_9ACTN|nr:winged helix DNA-binding domain-containing protein [Thermomonospora umbrina]REE97241.1 winged helix DNA-binding protein [Thermomonospora umbrina]